MIDTKALRQKILDMAIKGELVPQDPNDEPASVLLEKIRAEKQRLIKEGKIKKDKLDSVIFKGDDNRHYEKIGNEVKDITDEIDFELPDDWEYIRLSFIGFLAGGYTPKSEELANSGIIPYFKVADMNTDGNERYLIHTTNYLKSSPQKFFAKNSIVFPKNGGAVFTNKKRILAQDSVVDLNTAVFTPYSLIELDYVYLLFLTIDFNDFYKGTALPTIKNDFITTNLYGLPPVAEQKRIIKCVETLFAKIDIIEQNQADIETLYDELKKRTLNLAIQGKLVPQDENDEPASELLKRIHAEKKTQLGKKYVDSYIYKGDDNRYYEHIDGKTKDEAIEVPFDLPEKWAWSRIQDISESYIGLTYKPSDIVHENGSIVLRSSNIQNGKLNLTDIVRVKSTITEKLCVKKNDIIICARNGSKKLVGKSAIVDVDLPNLTFGAFMAICKTPIYKYTYVFLQSNLFFSQLAGVSGTTTINQLTQASFNSFLIPIPPLSEQKRIVDKINEIFAKL